MLFMLFLLCKAKQELPERRNKNEGMREYVFITEYLENPKNGDYCVAGILQPQKVKKEPHSKILGKQQKHFCVTKNA